MKRYEDTFANGESREMVSVVLWLFAWRLSASLLRLTFVLVIASGQKIFFFKQCMNRYEDASTNGES